MVRLGVSVLGWDLRDSRSPSDHTGRPWICLDVAAVYTGPCAFQEAGNENMEEEEQDDLAAGPLQYRR